MFHECHETEFQLRDKKKHTIVPNSNDIPNATMSLVRYNTSDSLEPIDNSKSLSVVYKNSSSNEVVLYDPIENEFQVVKLNNSHINDNFIPKSGIDFRRRSFQLADPIEYNGNSRSQRSTNKRRGRRRRSRANSSNNQTFICSVCGAFNNPEDSNINDNKLNETDINSENEDGYDSLNRFTTTNSGNFIRGDYFKLLTNSMNKKLSLEGLLTDGKSGNDVNDDYDFHMIPENLINQGYFDKFFKILSKLGSGSFGSVYKVEHDLLGLNLGVFALKKIPIGDDINNLKKILSEVKFLYDLSCNFSETNNNATQNMSNSNNNSNNVVKYNHVWVEIDQVSRFSPKIPVVFLLFEYCDGGTLEEWVDGIINPKSTLLEEKIWRKLKSKNNSQKPRYLNNFEIFKIFSDITKGLNYLHNLKILHRDLKPSNCLFKTRFKDNYNKSPINHLKDLNDIPTLVVSDFGESVMVNSFEESWQNIETTGTTGTLEFCAPEIILQRRKLYPKQNKFGGFSYASDVYSLGMILYYLCFGKLPFKNTKYDPDEISNEILSFDLFKNLNTIRPIEDELNENDNNDGLLKDWVELIDQMVSKNPNDRPGTLEILDKLMNIYNKLDVSNKQLDLSIAIKDNENCIDNSDEKESISDDGFEEMNQSSDALIGIHVENQFKNKMSNPSLWAIIMFAINITTLKLLDALYPLERNLSLLTNLQFLVLGLIFGGLRKQKWIIWLEFAITIITVIVYIANIL